MRAMKLGRSLILVFILALVHHEVRAAKAVAKVLSVEGRVMAQRTLLKAGMKLGEGVKISTGFDAKIKLFLYPRGVLYLGPSTVIRLKKKEKRNRLLKGAARFLVSASKKFKKLWGRSGPPLEVHTSNAVIGVRGTDFYVTYLPLLGETEIICFTGEIDFKNSKKSEDHKRVPSGHWGGLGGRFGSEIGNLIELSPEILNHFQIGMTWGTDLEGTAPAKDLGGEHIPTNK